ncbi:MAG: hypothetical protein ACI4M1_03080 [Christensenellales bacterium]
MTDITPVALWKGFDPDAEELNPRPIRSFTRDGVLYDYAYFTGRTKDKLTTRVACLCAHPENIGKKKLPVVIVCDIARNIDEDALGYWAKKGFAAFAIDYKGADCAGASEKSGAEVFGTIDSYEEDCVAVSSGLSTIYPVGMEYCNLNRAEKDFKSVERGADATCWYEWTLNTRRAVSFALTHDFADGRRIGIYGSHLGNIIAMQTLAMDGRVTAGAELYGTLREERVSRLEGEEALERESGNLVDFLEKSDNEDVWYAAVSPQSYLNYVTKPFYTCIGTNSSSSDPDATMEMLARMNNDNEGIAVFAPRLMDGAPSFYRDNLARWFKNIFEGKTVKNDAVALRAVCDRGRVFVEAARDRNQGGGVAHAEVYYSRSRRSVNSARNWVLAKRAEGEALRFNLEIFDADTPVRAFLNVTYKNGISMSFNMPEFVPSRLGSVLLSPKTKIILRGGEENEFVPMNHTGRQTASFVDAHPVKTAEGAFGIKGVCGSCMGTFAISDDRILRDEQSLLSMDIYSEGPQHLNIFLLYDWGEENQAVYVKEAELVGGELWQKILARDADFKSLEIGRPLRAGGRLCGICFEAEKEIVLTNLLFT